MGGLGGFAPELKSTGYEPLVGDEAAEEQLCRCCSTTFTTVDGSSSGIALAPESCQRLHAGHRDAALTSSWLLSGGGRILRVFFRSFLDAIFA